MGMGSVAPAGQALEEGRMDMEQLCILSVTLPKHTHGKNIDARRGICQEGGPLGDMPRIS